MADEKDNNSHGCGSWNVWARHILEELKRLDTCFDEVRQLQMQIRLEQARLQVKSGVWGALGASIPILIATLIWALTK